MINENEQKLYDILNKLDISYTRYEHIPVFTVEEANKLDLNIPGCHCKNLFLRNRKGNRHYLVILDDSKRADIKFLSEQIGAGGLSFASEDRLYKHLGVKPGSVTPFGLINDAEKCVEVIIDEDLIGADNISFHPNVNTATIVISYNGFEKFLEWHGNSIHYVRL